MTRPAPDFDPAGWTTAGEALAARQKLWAICEAPGCNHSREMLAELAAREPGLPLAAAAINPRLRCTRCGARRGSIRLVAGGAGTMQRP